MWGGGRGDRVQADLEGCSRVRSQCLLRETDILISDNRTAVTSSAIVVMLTCLCARTNFLLKTV